MFSLHVTKRDDFDDVGAGGRQNGDIWYREDLGEIRACLGGKIVTLFKISAGELETGEVVGDALQEKV